MINFFKKKGLESNFWKLAVLQLTNKRPYMVFMSIFLLTFPDVTIKTIGLLSLIGAIAGFVLEIPSGYISDKIGHKKALVISKLFLVLSTLMYIFGTSLVFFILGAVFQALSGAMKSGTSSAFLKDVLDELNMGDRFSSISGKINSLGFAASIVLILVCSWLGGINFLYGFILILCTDIVGLAISTSLLAPRLEKTVDEFDSSNIRSLVKEYLSLGWVRYVVFLELMFGIGFGVTAGFKNPFLESLGFSIASLGFMWALSRVLISVSSLSNGFLKKKLSLKKFVLCQALCYAILFTAIALIKNPYVIISLWMLPTVLRWGFAPLRSHYYLEFIGESKNKASLLSINSFLEKMITGIVGFAMGYSVFYFDYSYSYLLTGILFICIFVIASVVLLKKQA